ncbi:hypothetical protein HYFRA_00009219 [Hymenoscyphus fraxineus]|uniref:Uncharacterized protein n=1 Tax=Hymenoscyphus fraxineus TaxID=746836 RepID=A0A9N9KTT2_9HELO|nr:hypothetical protein HYFRA_00009219 [Hymenoscyphus fraxineus]
MHAVSSRHVSKGKLLILSKHRHILELFGPGLLIALPSKCKPNTTVSQIKTPPPSNSTQVKPSTPPSKPRNPEPQPYTLKTPSRPRPPLTRCHARDSLGTRKRNVGRDAEGSCHVCRADGV